MMQPTLNHARQTREQIHEQVRRYIPALLPRLALTYVLPFIVVLLVSRLIVSQFDQFLPNSTANALGFAVNLLVLFFLWRFLENRTHAAELMVYYTSYSRVRRNQNAMLAVAEANPAEDNEILLESTATLRQAGEAFIDAAKNRNLNPVER